MMTMGPKAQTHSVMMKDDLESNHDKSHSDQGPMILNHVKCETTANEACNH
jgi:hypothetical protein